MRSLLILLAFFFTAVHSLAQKKIDVLRYQFNLTLTDKSDTIKGLVRITFINQASSPEVIFDLSNINSSGKGMIVDSAAEIKNYNSFRTDVHHAEDKVTIKLSPSHPGDTQTVWIYYKGIPADGLIISKNKYGDRTFFADNWPNRAHCWLPCIDDPSDKASCRFIVTTPPQYTVISNGRPGISVVSPDNKDQKYETTWIEDVPLPTKVMVIGVAKFAVKEYKDSPKNIPVSAWVYPQDSAKGFQNYSWAPEIVKFFSNYIGPYPYEKLANVQSKTIFGGMENASAIFYYEESASSAKSVEDLQAHEIAHQWFGDMVTEKKYSHLWLSEGFATYMTDIYMESKYGPVVARDRLKKERDDVINFRNGQPVVDTVSKGMSLLNANSYQKGAWVLHMLRHEVGDSVFQLIIRKYYDQFKGKNADTEDFEKVVEETSHKDLKQFFKQWLYTSDIPRLDIKWKINNNRVSVTVTQMQQQLFQFPLKVTCSSKSGRGWTSSLNISKKTETFSLKSPAPITKVEIDRWVNLLFAQK